jgi:hypothetical protein
MRTVTFADLRVVAQLKADFIPIWHNQSPDLYAVRGRQEVYAPAQIKAYPEGGGGGNVRSYFGAADGTVLYYLQGYWSAERYLAEARFARRLAAQVAALPLDRRPARIRQALDERRAQVAAQRQAMRRRHPAEFKKKVYESEIGRRDAALGLLEQTLQASRDMAGKPLAPLLAQIRRQNRTLGVIK